MMKTSYNTFVYNPSLPQPEPQPALQEAQPALQEAQPQSNMMYSLLQPCLSDSYISPPFYHTPDTPINLTCVNMMTVDQTANWIRTLGIYKGWKEADEYAESFKENSITGQLLQQLSSEMLEMSLGMSNYGHRLEILCTIQHLFPGYPTGSNCIVTVPQPASVTGIEIMESPCESTLNDERRKPESDCGSTINTYLVPTRTNSAALRPLESDCESSYSHYLLSTCSTDGEELVQPDAMSESNYSKRSSGFGYLGNVEDDGLGMPSMTGQRKSQFVMHPGKKEDVVMSDDREDTISIRSTKRARYRKLIVTLRPDQVVKDGCPIERIRRRFEEFNAVVKVSAVKDAPNTYLVVFPSSDKAQEIFHQAVQIGYKLVKKWPARPNPKHPIKYKSMTTLRIRTGKAFSGDIVGDLEKGAIVTVNQVKGRRARMIKEDEKGEPVTIGWVSVHTSEGEPLLRQLAEL